MDRVATEADRRPVAMLERVVESFQESEGSENAFCTNGGVISMTPTAKYAGLRFN